MSLSGLFLLVFLTLHLFLNLTRFVSAEAYEDVCKFMDETLLVQAMVPVLALGFIVHIVWAICIEFKNWTARPRTMAYAVPNRTKATSWASKNMFVLGLIILAGLLFVHLFDFWSHMQLQSFLGKEGAKPSQLIIDVFSSFVKCVVYVVWFVAIALHASHGFWSAFQTLGLNNEKWLPRLRAIAAFYAVVVCVAYAIIPLVIYFLMQNYDETLNTLNAGALIDVAK